MVLTIPRAHPTCSAQVAGHQLCRLRLQGRLALRELSEVGYYFGNGTVYGAPLVWQTDIYALKYRDSNGARGVFPRDVRGTRTLTYKYASLRLCKGAAPSKL
jgi:hypothetical protein